MSDLGKIKFFITPSHSCSYLPNQRASTLFADPNLIIDQHAYTTLSDIGFRRSGEHLYRPHCESCNACIPMRVLAQENTLSKAQRRVSRQNSDLYSLLKPSQFSDEYYDLYARYIISRHSDGDMFPPNREQFNSFLLSRWSNTQFLEIRETHTQRLVSVAVTDRLTNGLSAIYTFFDPDEPKRSLGTFSVIQQLKLTKELGLRYLFIGYWIKSCNKMSYKNQFRPTEMYLNHSWERIN